ncbi:unnamed protein product [Enterobius vermicularis]|uniref:SCP domain-containing protein n=1 Tax=Enterobius vermicularis TaxID=51028 RepID=A0A0N4V342_ENTVE|nr:unnamed protein product [Enterobius vermicularis]
MHRKYKIITKVSCCLGIYFLVVYPLKLFYDSSQRCQKIISFFGFNLMPLSEEEEKYPLAYGMLVYKWTDQVYYTVSAFYQPQNQYCIGIDNKSDRAFKRNVGYLAQCFPNIHVMEVPAVSYCGHSVIWAVHLCLRYLTSLPSKWKYYQYLTGFDLPLKTNHQMVRIFKQLNGSFNGEVKAFQLDRLRNKSNMHPPYKLKLFKSSLSATFSRETAEFLASSREAMALLSFLNGTFCPDESFWTTLIGNKNGSYYCKPENLTAVPFYISQCWLSGKYVSASCAFGVGDVPSLLQRPQLVAHKFYLDYEPAAYFCLYQKVRERAQEDIASFNEKPYGDLPGPRLTRGEDISEWFKNNAY